MTKFQIHNATSGADLGIYCADSELHALNELARFAGYRDYEHACDVTGDDAWDLIVSEVA